MTKKPIERQFCKYVIPSMFTMLLSGFYAIVDGFFIGQSVGDIGLGAINLAWPIAATILAVGTGIGVGGAVVMSTEQGKGAKEEADKVRGNTLLLLSVSTLVLTLILILGYPLFLRFLGAEDRIYTYAAEYIRVVAIACGLQLFGTGLTPLLRNSGKAIIAMAIMISGLVTNIVLDAVFIMIFDWGMFGAALATVIAQGVVAIIAGIILLCDKKNKVHLVHLKPNKKLINQIVRVGISPFGLSLSPSVIIIFANWQCLNYGGEVAVAAYSVISYIMASVQGLLQGVGDGIQPLISFCKGAKAYDSMHAIRKKAFKTVLALSIIMFLIAMPARDVLPALFGTSVEAGELIRTALFICSFAIPLIGIVRLSSSYFYAVEDARFSSLLVYTDPLIITPIMMMLLPKVLELNGVWLALPVAQGILTIAAIFMFKKHFKEIEIGKI